jgi:lysophospholipase L1-like esterase
MKQVFMLGSSFVYGVGGINGGWAGLVKNYLHELMYSNGGIGEKYEAYNLGMSGATIDFVLKQLNSTVKDFSRDVPKMAIVNVGGNNSKAVDDPSNFVSTIEDYKSEVVVLLQNLNQHFDRVIFVGSGYVDETKTNPKFNPLDGGNTYHTNERKMLFNSVTNEICGTMNIPYISLNLDETEWAKDYLYEDGLHSNDAGYGAFFEAIKPHVSEFISEITK